GVVAANSTLIMAMVCYLEGTLEFRGRRTYCWPVYAAAVLTIAIVTYFNYFAPRVNIRIVAMSLFVALICILCAVTLSSGKREEHTIGTVFSTGAFGLCAAVLVSRAVYFVFAPAYTNLFAPTLVNDVFLGGLCMSLAGCPIGFILMADER